MDLYLHAGAAVKALNDLAALVNGHRVGGWIIADGKLGGVVIAAGLFNDQVGFVGLLQIPSATENVQIALEVGHQLQLTARVPGGHPLPCGIGGIPIPAADAQQPGAPGQPETDPVLPLVIIFLQLKGDQEKILGPQIIRRRRASIAIVKPVRGVCILNRYIGHPPGALRQTVRIVSRQHPAHDLIHIGVLDDLLGHRVGLGLQVGPGVYDPVPIPLVTFVIGQVGRLNDGPVGGVVIGRGPGVGLNVTAVVVKAQLQAVDTIVPLFKEVQQIHPADTHAHPENIASIVDCIRIMVTGPGIVCSIGVTGRVLFVGHTALVDLTGGRQSVQDRGRAAQNGVPLTGRRLIGPVIPQEVHIEPGAAGLRAVAEIIVGRLGLRRAAAGLLRREGGGEGLGDHGERHDYAQQQGCEFFQSFVRHLFSALLRSVYFPFPYSMFSSINRLSSRT